jgi:hypothetical protein
VQPALSSYLIVGSSSDPITTTYRYDPASNDLLEVDRVSYGGITEYGYDAHHSVITTTELLDSNTTSGVAAPSRRPCLR